VASGESATVPPRLCPIMRPDLSVEGSASSC
jgi:hypothetical protein